MVGKILKGPTQNLPTESFGKTLFDCLRNGGFRVAMVHGVTGENVTYKELLDKSTSLAHYLKKFALSKNDTISVSSENSLCFSIPVLSALYLGITVSPMNPAYTAREFLHALRISKPKVIFCTYAILDNIMQAGNEAKCVKKIIVLDKNTISLPNNVQNLDEFINLSISDNFQITEVETSHPAAILFSSGTTGLPKGVMLSHGNVHSAHEYMRHPRCGNHSSDVVGLALLPMYHAYCFINHLLMICSNMKMVVLSRFEEKTFLNSIQQYKVTNATLVPPVILLLEKSPTVDNYNLSSLKDILCGAAPLSKDVQAAVRKRLGVNIRQGYGFTENTLASTILPLGVQNYGSVGVIVPGVELKVVDVKTQEILGPNQSGEICVRGNQVMKGYVGDPSATGAIFDKDGWLHTGDVGYYDEDDFLYIVDRYKELIKYKGFQVPPAEVEGVLITHPEIIDCAVIGKPDEKAGELPVAFVVRRPKSVVTEKDIIDFVAGNVSYPKRLRGGVIFLDSIPKNPTGKILRRVLRERLQKVLSSKL